MSKKTAIVGGGIIGLNIALYLAETRKGGDIFLFEREKYLGHHTSTRNSEVIHGGFAYPPGSLKARLCVEGNRMTYALLDRLRVKYLREGKWIIARDERECLALKNLMANAAECKVPGMRDADPKEVVKNVPEAAYAIAAAFSESSGIMDAAGYIKAIEIKLSGLGNVNILYPCELLKIVTAKKVVSTSRGEMEFDILINSAGLFADDVYKMAGGRRAFEIRPCKGEYYTWRKGTINGLVYPVAHRFLSEGDAAKVSSMGVHLHRSVAGDLFIGPTEEMLPPSEKINYSINISAEKISELVSPLLNSPPNPKELEQAFAGNRPKLFENGKPFGDFMIFRDGDIVHLLGMESPGLTSAPAVAKYVVENCLRDYGEK